MSDQMFQNCYKRRGGGGYTSVSYWFVYIYISQSMAPQKGTMTPFIYLNNSEMMDHPFVHHIHFNSAMKKQTIYFTVKTAKS